MDHLVLIRNVKILQHLSYLSTSITRTNMYKYSVSLLIQIYKLFFKITVLCNDQNSKEYATFKHFTQVCEQNCYKIKNLITRKNDVFMKYERQLCKTTVEWYYTKVRTISLLEDWKVHPNTVCALSCKTSLLLVKSGKRKINPLFGTTFEEVLLSRMRLCYSMEYSI